MRIKQNYWIENIKLSTRGELYAKEALKEMQGLSSLEVKYHNKKPLKGIKIIGSVLVSYETANFVLLLKKLGAIVRWCSDSLYYSADDACAYIAAQGIPIFAKKGMSRDEYYWAFNKAAEFKDADGKTISPDFIIDDGAEFTEYLLKHNPQKINKVKGMLEQTTSGITLMYNQFLNKGKLPFPVINVNDSVTKAKFDNIYGSRESLLEGLLNAINVQIAGKRVVIFGFGEVGKGCAQAMKGVGGRVSIVEIDPIMAMQALMEGYEVLNKTEASRIGDIFITTTGCIKTIDKQEIMLMKSGAFLMNMSEHDTEVNSHFFRNNPKLKKIKLNEYCDKYIFPNKKEIYLLCNGYIVNLYAGQGHPPKVMGVTFTNHIVALLNLVKHPEKYSKPNIYRLSRQLDEEVARLSFPELKDKISKLTSEQADYLGINIDGPYKRDDYRY